ncbi:hypothetical protein TRVL_08521 [Trypanosoma vivax]|nr:hypothetical protein TRVL_08521 [Trypanosoma vivax]
MRRKITQFGTSPHTKAAEDRHETNTYATHARHQQHNTRTCSTLQTCYTRFKLVLGSNHKWKEERARAAGPRCRTDRGSGPHTARNGRGADKSRLFSVFFCFVLPSSLSKTTVAATNTAHTSFEGSRGHKGDHGM